MLKFRSRSYMVRQIMYCRILIPTRYGGILWQIDYENPSIKIALSTYSSHTVSYRIALFHNGQAKLVRHLLDSCVSGTMSVSVSAITSSFAYVLEQGVDSLKLRLPCALRLENIHLPFDCIVCAECNGGRALPKTCNSQKGSPSYTQWTHMPI